jgi:hypothetical protein
MRPHLRDTSRLTVGSDGTRPGPGDEAAAALLEVTEASKAIKLDVEQPFGVVELLLAPGWRDRLHARRGHNPHMGSLTFPPSARHWLRQFAAVDRPASIVSCRPWARFIVARPGQKAILVST